MMNPVRTATGWLAGRLIVFLVVLVVLVAWDAYRDESVLMGAMLKGLVPDRNLVERLERDRLELLKKARVAEKTVNDRMERLHAQTTQEIDDRIAVLDSEIKARESQRLPEWRKAVALATGQGLKEDLANELQIQVSRAERGGLMGLKGEMSAVRAATVSAEQFELSTKLDHRRKCARFTAAKAIRQQYIELHPVLIWVPGTSASKDLNHLDRMVNLWAHRCVLAFEKYNAARWAVTEAKKVRAATARQIVTASESTLQPLEDLIDHKKAAVNLAEQGVQKVFRSARKVFLQAFGILVLVTLAPVGIKAFWYWVMAPYAEGRPPIRLWNRVDRAATNASAEPSEPEAARKVSAVSQEVTINEREELLVQPEFLQRSANRALKKTKWLLTWEYPLTSIAAGMVALDRLRVTSPESFVISSKTDPFAEVGVIPLLDGEILVLQPRHLVGVVQPIDRPIHIHRRWRFNWHAIITLQFRFLMFEGPAKLIVQGCRGVRLEYAGRGRSIDQGATMGFSANLAYSPRRSETFSAYLMGTRALFNDNFTGGPGFYVYEEMPYSGKRSGITGRGLEGLTDGLLKIAGI